MHPLETYIREMREIRSTGSAVAETSYYGPLANLINEIGRPLKVKCVINLTNAGAGLPDGGFFTPSQMRRGGDLAALFAQIPERGAMEVKGTGADVVAISQTQQVKDYIDHYGLVLVTNYRDFLLMSRGPNGVHVAGERYTIAASEEEFWLESAHPRRMAERHGERLKQYILRVLLQRAPLTAPKDVAWLLASYARDAKSRIECAEDLDALNTIRSALEEALGLKFEGEKGEHFFRSTLVQTLFYGLFSAWVLWSKSNRDNPQARFNWHEAAYTLHVPMISALFYQMANPTHLGALGLNEVMDWAGEALNRVVADEFFARFEDEHAVQYFYEPFLEAFDPQLRKDLGVWYTPPEIVKYMVARVDTVLREELDIADGLADPNVYVLDPCCGTGAYLVEVLKSIEATLRSKGGDALVAHNVKTAATSRVFGFELLPAPYVVAHLQLGLMLGNMGAPLTDANGERAGVYLTNALTGWEPPREPHRTLTFPELEQEREAAGEVKRAKPIIVVLGNPPYNGYAGVAIDEERELSNAYRTTQRAPAPQGQGLNDYYVRFYRMAERRITEGEPGKGIVCFISNYSWLDGLSFTGMRERYLSVFDKICIDNLHGDRIISEYAPDGQTSETVFAVTGTSVGIKIGTAIGLLARTGQQEQTSSAHLAYRDLQHARAHERRAALLASAHDGSLEASYTALNPVLELGLPLKPRSVCDEYLDWPVIPDVFPVSFPGVKTSRDEALVDMDREALSSRMLRYLDANVEDSAVRNIAPRLMEDGARFDAAATRRRLLSVGFSANNLVRYCYRPFDVRWLYWEAETKLLDEKRAEFRQQVRDGNLFLVSQQKSRREWSRPQAIRALGCLDLMDRGASCIPLKVFPQQHSLFSDSASGSGIRPNVSPEAHAYLTWIGMPDGAEVLLLAALSIMHAPAYAAENSGALRQDWPRIPLPGSKDLLLQSAELGRQIAALLDTETEVEGVTTGTIRPELARIGLIRAVGGGQLNPDAGDLAITAGWGHAGQGGVTMPGKGKYAERTAPAPGILGDTALDIYLNDRAFWSNIPRRVWDYHIGGYQVIKKWLSYRESDLLGRSLKLEEVTEVTNMARRIAAIILLEPELDANYESVKANCYPWPRTNLSPPSSGEG